MLTKRSRHAARGVRWPRNAERAALPCSYLLLMLFTGVPMVLFDRNPSRNELRPVCWTLFIRIPF